MKTIQSAYYIAVIVFMISVTMSCSNKIESREFLKWLSEEDNGLVKTKKSNGFEIKMKYLPPVYFVSRELISYDLKNKAYDRAHVADSIKKEFSNNIYFLLHIDNDTSIVKENADVMFRDIYNYGDYTSRIYKYNFNINEDIELLKNNKVYHPVLSSFENHYGMEGGRNLLLVFAPQKDSTEFSSISDLEVIFNDEELGIGTTHFRFEKSDLEDVPDIIY